ncbi:MAG: hypothetical protein EBZ77_13000 [Chitinophagia bacterium]|nr:hypothetical protein [Chitinophagia bacterium]
MTVYAIPYNPVTVGSGTNGPSGDDAQTLVTLPFSFNYFGTNYSSVRICTNGFINFGASSTLYTPVALPSTSAAQGMVALFWHDLTATAGQIKYTTIGSSPNRKFVVNFNAVADLSGAGTNTGQVILYETSNMIDIFVANSNAGGATNLCGIQNGARTIAVTPPGENATSFSVSSPGEGWRFVVPSYSYNWAPAGSLSASTGDEVVSSGLTSTQVYTVTTRDIYSTCAGNVSTTTVTLNPINIYSVTGGNGCTSTGVSVGLSSSDVGANYQLYFNGSSVGLPVAGTGSALSFGTYFTAGYYTVVASRGSCTANMNGADTIGTTPSLAIGASPAICQPAATGDISFSSVVGTPTTYNVTWDAAALSAGFSYVSGAALGSLINLTIEWGNRDIQSGRNLAIIDKISRLG